MDEDVTAVEKVEALAIETERLRILAMLKEKGEAETIAVLDELLKRK